jgi:hypothetical protein
MNIVKLSSQIVLPITILMMAGCGELSEYDAAQPTLNTTVLQNEQAIEAFVFMATSERKNVNRQVETLVLNGLPGGSTLHLIECPDHRVVASASIPFGSPKARMKNRLLQREYSQISEYFHANTKPEKNDRLGYPSVSETVQSLRRTKLDCRVILCGSPIHDDPDDTTFTMANGLVPSDGLIGHTHSPWTVEPAFPLNTQVSWLTANNRWGRNAKQRKAVTRFVRLLTKELGGHLVRITPDPSLAFSFAQPHLKNDLLRRDEKPAMFDPQVETKLDQMHEKSEPTIVPVEKARVSFSKPDSIRYEIEMAGGDPAKMSGDRVVLQFVYDGSGSMAPHIETSNKMIVRIAQSLPELVASLEIGVAVHREGSTDVFPILEIKRREHDGGASIDRLKSFLSAIKARDGDALMQNMLADGTARLSNTSPTKRQVLMLVADFVRFDEKAPETFNSVATKLTESAASWCGGTDRRVIALYSGPTGNMEQFFRNIGSVNENSRFTNQPKELVASLISKTIPVSN